MHRQQQISNLVGLKPNKAVLAQIHGFTHSLPETLDYTQRCIFPCLTCFHQDQVRIILGRSFVCCVEADLEFCLCQVMLVLVLCPCL